MTSIRRLFGLALLLLLAPLPAAANEYTSRSYSLHTLDYRVAETLVWGICDENEGRGSECRVLSASPGGLTVHAAQSVHARIVEMLTERDETTPASLLFEIVLVRLTDNGKDRRGDRGLADHQQRALDAIREVFPGKRAEIYDTGLIRTASEGQTQLADASGDLYTALIDVRSIVGGADGLVITVDLQINHGETTLLTSRVTLAEGETVVAGSSRAAGDTAVVLLTSMNRS